MSRRKSGLFLYLRKDVVKPTALGARMCIAHSFFSENLNPIEILSLCPVENGTVLDVFIIPDTNDIDGFPIPIDINQ